MLEGSRKYREEHREEIRKKKKSYPSNSLEQRRKYWQENKDRLNARRRELKALKKKMIAEEVVA